MRQAIRAVVLLTVAVMLLSSVGLADSHSVSFSHYQYLPTVLRGRTQPQPCLPRYSEREFLLQVNDTSVFYEAFPVAADLNGDGLEDVIIQRTKYLTYETFPLDILLNDGKGGMTLATSTMFSGPVPVVQNPTTVLVADFNGDGRSDIYVADHGYDLPPFPGYQNVLVLSTPEGRLVDATSNLPQQMDFTHSAAAADIDGDGDIDLFNGNYNSPANIDPQILVNNGGRFSIGANRLPPLLDLDLNHYSSCEFCDVDSDGDPDLVFGAGEEDVSTVLRNDGAGVFTAAAGSMPPKESLADIAHDIETVDVNGDGLADLLMENQRPNDTSYIQVLINNGNGTFRDETASRLEGFDRPVSTPFLELRDFDRDGDLDLLAMPWDADRPDPLLFLNDGHGVFRRQPFDFGLQGGDLYLTLLDLEGDGGHDVLLTLNFPPDRVFVHRDLGCAP